MSVWKQQAKSKGDGDGFEKPPPGNHPAVLVAIIDMGTQKNDFQGKVNWQRRAFFVWELVLEKQAGFRDRNHVIGIDLTISLNEKARLRQWIEARVGKAIPEGHEYDITAELGKPCLLNVVTTKSGHSKVDGMKGIPKGMTVAPAQNTPFLWSLDEMPDDTAKLTLPDWLPYLYGEPLTAHILRCKEVTGGAEPAAVGVGNPDADDPTIPF